MSLATGLVIVREAVRSRINPKINHLILHITNLCNFRCNHCFVDFKESPIDLTLDEIRSIAKDVPPLIWLDIGGGEPFLRRDIHEIIALFKAREISIPTNGWFTDRIIKQLKKIEDTRGLESLILTISVDGLPNTHDHIRKRKGSYKRLKHTYFELRRLFPQLRIKINSVLCRENYSEFLDFMDHIYETFQPEYHGIQFLRGNPINNEYALPSIEEIEAIENKLRQKQKIYDYGRKGLLSRVSRNYQALKRDISRDIIRTETQTIHCYGGQVHLVVYADGKVAPCETLAPVASIRDQSLSTILQSKEWENTVAAIIRRDCHCTHDCNMMENILFDFKNYPRLLSKSQAS